MMTKQILLLPLMATHFLMAYTDDPLVKPEKPLISIEDKLHAYGDYRIRDQEVHRDDKESSYQQRYRIRMGLSYDISDVLVFEAQLSSGKGDPTSGNVPFSDGMDKEKFRADILDLEYKMDDAWLRAGMSKHYFYRPMKTQLIWDNDLRPQGLSYGYDNGDKFTAGIAQVRRLELKDDPNTDDIYMLTAQYMHEIAYTQTTTLNLTGGFYYYNGVKGNTAPYAKGPLGNSYTNGTYDHDYAIAELSAEAQLKEVWGKPFYVAMTFAYNTAVSEYNKGYDFSMQWGSAKKNNLDWQLGYTYRNIEKDSVYGAHNDSDFIAGGTDGRGSIMTGKIKLNTNLDAAFHYQWTDKFISTSPSHYDRIMTDLILKF